MAVFPMLICGRLVGWDYYVGYISLFNVLPRHYHPLKRLIKRKITIQRRPVHDLTAGCHGFSARHGFGFLMKRVA